MILMRALALALSLAAAICGAPAFAQPALDAPPALPPAETSATPAAPAARGKARAEIKLPAAERLRQEERARQEAVPVAPEPLTEPPDDQLLPPARQVAPETRIEQKRQGNRVVEIVVTPKGSSSSYVIVNREGRPPLSNQELSSGLSTPRFLRFDF